MPNFFAHIWSENVWPTANLLYFTIEKSTPGSKVLSCFLHHFNLQMLRLFCGLLRANKKLFSFLWKLEKKLELFLVKNEKINFPWKGNCFYYISFYINLMEYLPLLFLLLIFNSLSALIFVSKQGVIIYSTNLKHTKLKVNQTNIKSRLVWCFC